MLKPTSRIQRLLFSIILFLSLFEPAMAVATGEPAPNIFGRTLENKLFRLSDITNPVVVNFFWVECKPCVKEMPELAKLEKSYPNVQVISVHVGDEDKSLVAGFVNKLSASPKTIVVASPMVKASYQIRALPHTVVIKEGKIVAIIEGFNEKGMNRLLQILKEL